MLARNELLLALPPPQIGAELMLANVHQKDPVHCEDEKVQGHYHLEGRWAISALLKLWVWGPREEVILVSLRA